MPDYEDFDNIEIEGAIDEEPSNVIEKGRYPFTVKDVRKGESKNGNPTMRVILLVEGKEITDYLIMVGKMEWKFKKFLFCIGVRNKNQTYKITKEMILGGKGLVDIAIRDRTLEDESIIKENIVRNYSPLENAEAPIAGVPAEIEEIEEVKEEVKEEKSEEKPKKEKPKSEEEDDI